MCNDPFELIKRKKKNLTFSLKNSHQNKRENIGDVEKSLMWWEYVKRKVSFQGKWDAGETWGTNT